jgi:hypothetical protein
MDPNFNINYKKLVKTFKHLPALAPIGIGAAALQEEKDGGWLDQYQNAGSTGVRQPFVLSPQEIAQAQAIADYKKYKASLSKEDKLALLSQQPSGQPAHTLRKTEKQGLGSKAYEVLINPFTAATNLYQHGSLPDNFSQGPTNALDIAPQWINPAFYAEAVYNTGKAAFKPQTYSDIAKTVQTGALAAMGEDIGNDWQEPVLNTVGIVLDAGMAKGAGKQLKKVAKKLNNKAARTYINLKQGLGEGLKESNIPTNMREGLGSAKDVARMKDLKTYGLKTEFIPTQYQRKLDTDLIKYNNEYGTSFNIRNPNPTRADKLTGYTDIPGFNKEMQYLKDQAQYGKKQMLTKDQFFNQADINNMVKQENNYYKALEEFENANPQSGSDMMMQAFSGDKSYMKKFKNLYPNVSLPDWGAKFIPEYEVSQLLNKKWSNKNNPLGKYLGKGSPMDKLTDAGKGLRRQLDNDWSIRDPKGYLKEMRGRMNLSKMSDEEIAKEAKKVQDALNTQYIERYKKDIAKPFRGSDAFQQLTPNKYGGQQKGWLDNLH